MSDYLTDAASGTRRASKRLGDGHEKRTGAPRYDCALPYWVPESTERTYAFQLRIDALVPGAAGEVSIHPEFGDFAFDPDITDNTAVLAVN